jgi:hypothetical protein
MESSTDLIARRIAKLERENRVLKIGGLGLALFIVGLHAMGTSGSPRTIEAEKIVLLDQHGHPRIVMGTSLYGGPAFGMKSDDPAIWLADDKGVDRAILATEGLYFATAEAKPAGSYLPTTGPSSAPKR